jgi:hypothetical protein
MRSPEARQEQAVEIASAVAVFLGVLAVGVTALTAVGLLTDISRSFAVGLTWVVGVAALAAVSRLMTRRSPPGH